MKAIVLNGFGDVSNFSLEEISIPEIKNDEVLIELKASAFNPIDYQMRQGLRESLLMKSPVLGRECSGIIAAVGSEVKGFALGDEIIALSGSRGSNGSYASHMTLNYQFLAHKPGNISFEVGAAIPASGATAWQCFSRMEATAGSRIFINGAAGGVGRFLISLLLAHGCLNIIATAGSVQSRAALERLGLKPEQIVDYKVENLEERLLNSNGSAKFDYSVDLVGGQQSELAASILKVTGTYVDVTFLGTAKTREILFDKACLVINIAGYAYAMDNNMSWYGHTLGMICKMIAEAKILAPEINILGELNVETVRNAHHLMETNQIYSKKLIMRI